MPKDARPVRTTAQTILDQLFAFTAGAYLILLYLDSTLQPAVATVHHLRNGIAPLFFIAMFATQVLQWRNRDVQASGPEPSQAWSAAFVVAGTGLAASFFVGSGFHRASDLLLAAIVLVPTVVATLLIVRFARRHEKEIGEARFDTRNPQDAPGAG